MEKARFERANSKRPDLQSGAVGHFATSPDTKCLSTYPHEVDQVSQLCRRHTKGIIDQVLIHLDGHIERDIQKSLKSLRFDPIHLNISIRVISESKILSANKGII